MFGHWVLKWIVECVPQLFQCIAGYPLPTQILRVGRKPQKALTGRVAQQDYG